MHSVCRNTMLTVSYTRVWQTRYTAGLVDTQACTMQALNAVRSSLFDTQNLMMQKSAHGRLHVQQCL